MKRLALLIREIVKAPLVFDYAGRVQDVDLDDAALKAELQRLWATCGEWETCVNVGYHEVNEGTWAARDAETPAEGRA